MNIRDLMDEQHRGEEIREGKVGIRKLLLPVSILVLAHTFVVKVLLLSALWKVKLVALA